MLNFLTNFFTINGKSVIVLVKFSNEDDLLPAEEADAERLYRIAYQQILPVYQAIAKASVLTDGPKPSIEAGANLSFEPSMHNSFMMTLDAKPYFNSKAVAMKIQERRTGRLLGCQVGALVCQGNGVQVVLGRESSLRGYAREAF